jgi:branched-chain amino acid transport system permease protein
MDLILLKLLNGVTTGVIYAMTTFGLAIILGLLNIPNFAHGVLFALGAYVGLTLYVKTGSFVLSLLLGPLFVGDLGILLERTLIKRLYAIDPDLSYQLLLLFAFAIMVQEAIILIWGSVPISVMAPEIFLGAVSIGPVFYPKYRLFVLCFAAVMIALVVLLIERTRLGAIIRATIEKPNMVMLLGIDIRYVYALSFGLGAAMAALSGALSLPLRGAHPLMGMDILPVAFVVAVLGGLGTLYGVIFAGLLIGVAQEFATLIDPIGSWAAGYAVMGIILLFRPQGLFGRR